MVISSQKENDVLIKPDKVIKYKNSNIILNISNLSIGYDKKVIAENISFNLKKGELVAIVGVNGIGKSIWFHTN